MPFSTRRTMASSCFAPASYWNGGAIIVLLTAGTHQSDSIVIALGIIHFSIVLLVFGLVCAVVAAVFSYLNFEREQSTLSDAKMKRYRNIALACATLSLVFFLRGGNRRSFICERSANFRNRWVDRKMKTKNMLARPEATPLVWHHLDHCRAASRECSGTRLIRAAGCYDQRASGAGTRRSVRALLDFLIAGL